MRLGKLKNILDAAIDQNQQLIFDVENLYDGKRFLVKNYDSLMYALKSLKSQPWVNADKKVIASLAKKYDFFKYDSIEISPDEYSQLSNLISIINKSLPQFYGILTVLVHEQDAQVVNILIPEKSIQDFDALNKFNKDLQDVFDLIVKYKGLNGDIEFQGFDVGTSWYTVLIVGGHLVYLSFLGAINIAEKMIHLRKGWYESEHIKWSVEIVKEQLNPTERQADLSDDDINKHVESLVEKALSKEVSELISKLPEINGNENEMHSSICKGVKKIIPLLEKGTEFYPSLNPPEYIKQGSEYGFKIDYRKLKVLLENTEQEKLESETKQIEDNSKKV
jgi:hypothetical protein